MEPSSQAPERHHEETESSKPLEAAYLRAMFITDVVKASAAEKAGLQRGDEVIEVDGEPVRSMESYYAYAAEKKDQPMLMTVLRGGERQEVTIAQAYDEATERYRMGIGFVPAQLPNEKIEVEELEGRIVEQRSGRMLKKDGSELCSYRYGLDADSKKCATSTKRADRFDASKDERVRRMRSFVIRHPETGVEMDLFAAFNAEDVPVYMKNGNLPDAAGFHDPSSGEVVLGRVTGNALYVHVLLHELRHARQEKDQRLSSIRQLYGIDGRYTEDSYWSPPAGSSAAEALQREGEDFLLMLRSLCKDIGAFGLEFSVDDLEPKIEALIERLHEIHSINVDDGHPEVVTGYKKRKAEKSEIKRAILNTPMAPDVTVHDLLMLPRRVIERDAEFGALSGERRIRKETGISFFGEIYDTYKEDMREVMRGQGQKTLEAQRALLTPEEQERFDVNMRYIEKEEAASPRIIDAVRGYMTSIGATPKAIRAYYEGGERKEG